ncbi:MAG: AraC family transcriptional regulator [Pseudomonadales bacterium]|nr:AraC family transcriptional regulator [Pseudomonadales bacterium]
MHVSSPKPTSRGDPLSDVVGSIDLVGSVFLSAEFTAPWAIIAHVTEEDCLPFMPVPRQVIAYHVVTEGQAIVSLDKGEGYQVHYRAQKGDVVILPSNPLHILASETGVEPVSGDELLLPVGSSGLARISHGGGGDRTNILCGFMAGDSGPVPLLNTLPEILIVNIESMETRRWIEASITMAAREVTNGRPSGTTLVPGVCRLLLIEALRSYMEQNPKPGGWLAGMAHPRISRALARIHLDLAIPMRVEDLAAEVGMSRSAFVSRFTELMGVGPRQYILSQRIETAAGLLRETDLTSAQIAFRVGYDAPEAFSRAFKRETGKSPSDWRRLP